MSKHSVNIANSTVGAFAFGSGAVAEAATANEVDSGQTYRFTFEARHATKEQIAIWLRTAADAVEGDYATTLAKTIGEASRGWSIEAEKK